MRRPWRQSVIEGSSAGCPAAKKACDVIVPEANLFVVEDVFRRAPASAQRATRVWRALLLAVNCLMRAWSWWKYFREERQKLSSSSDQYPENSRKAHAENMLVCWDFANSENLRKYGARL